MSDTHSLPSHSSTNNAVMPGFWELASGRALSLQPRESGVLRIAEGKVWATVDGPHCGAGNQSGDHVLQAGMQLAVQAGQRLVFEPFERTSQQAVLFEWAPDTDLVSSRTVQSAATVTQALQDLRLALGLVGDALMRLCTGLTSYGRQLVWGRGAVHAPHCG